jgi:hypothetical protein
MELPNNTTGNDDDDDKNDDSDDLFIMWTAVYGFLRFSLNSELYNVKRVA